MVGGDVTIHARIGGEAEDVDIHVVAGEVVEKDLCVHFAIRPQVAWDNVHHHCACLLPFRTASDVPAWSERHGIPVGAVVPIETVARLGREWYGRHCDPDWRKCTVAEANAIFKRVGLEGPFWALDERDGAY